MSLSFELCLAFMGVWNCLYFESWFGCSIVPALLLVVWRVLLRWLSIPMIVSETGTCEPLSWLYNYLCANFDLTFSCFAKFLVTVFWFSYREYFGWSADILLEILELFPFFLLIIGVPLWRAFWTYRLCLISFITLFFLLGWGYAAGGLFESFCWAIAIASSLLHSADSLEANPFMPANFDLRLANIDFDTWNWTAPGCCLMARALSVKYYISI